MIYPNQKFELGEIVATNGAVDALHNYSGTALQMLMRHASGDWGDVDSEDKAANDYALEFGQRLVSVYYTPDKVKIWLITEHDRSVTTFLLPSEY